MKKKKAVRERKRERERRRRRQLYTQEYTEQSQMSLRSEELGKHTQTPKPQTHIYTHTHTQRHTHRHTNRKPISDTDTEITVAFI